MFADSPSCSAKVRSFDVSVPLAPRDQKLRVRQVRFDRGARVQQHVEAFLVLVPPDREQDRTLVGDAEGVTRHAPPIRRAFAEFRRRRARAE